MRAVQAAAGYRRAEFQPNAAPTTPPMTDPACGCAGGKGCDVVLNAPDLDGGAGHDQRPELAQMPPDMDMKPQVWAISVRGLQQM